jgi:cytochrome c
MRKSIFGPILAGLALLSTAGAQAPPAGKPLFERRCGGCHALDRDKEGPRLGGVYGRTAGTVASFEYSDALKKSQVRWTMETLDRWLTDPEKLVPGNDMAFRVSDATERAAIIAYLKR